MRYRKFIYFTSFICPKLKGDKEFTKEDTLKLMTFFIATFSFQKKASFSVNQANQYKRL